ncbi:hypothetical protein GF362_01430 [Candidatus Dojkabacteria bacterium]|nr:hypothetical protein [Candidatus Dojkabacteria bacterium]
MGLFGRGKKSRTPVRKPPARRPSPTSGGGKPVTPSHTEGGGSIKPERRRGPAGPGNDMKAAITRTPTPEAEAAKADMLKADPFEGLPDVQGLRELAELYVGDGADFEGWNEMPSALRSLLVHIAENLPDCPVDLVKEIVTKFRENNTSEAQLQEILKLMETDERFKDLSNDSKYSLLLALLGERVVRMLKRYDNPQFVGVSANGKLEIGGQVDVEQYSNPTQAILNAAKKLAAGGSLVGTSFGNGYYILVSGARVRAPAGTLGLNRFLPTNINY